MDKYVVIKENDLAYQDAETQYIFGGCRTYTFNRFATQEDAEAWASKKSAKNVDNSYIVFQAVSRVEAKLPDANITKL